MNHETIRNGGSDIARRHRSSRSLSPRPRSHSHDKHDRERDSRRHYRHREGSHRPADYDDDDHSDKKEARSRHHPHRHSHHHHRRRGSNHSRRREASPVSAAPRVLPYNARQLSKHDLSQMEPMFAMYLDIQKGLILGDLNEREVKGRWKSFVKRWNNGELAEGWYDPATFEKAVSGLGGTSDSYSRTGEREPLPTRVSEARSDEYDDRPNSPRGRSLSGTRNGEHDNEADEDDEDEIYGPTLPNQVAAYRNTQSGPTIPKLQDLEIQREIAQEDARAARSTALLQHKEELRRHKDQICTAQEEVAPRAEPGTHERKMEKRREVAAANREFAAGRRGGSPTMDAAPDSELMGGTDGDLEALKKAKEQEQRKKNEREIRREEIARARRMEREERLAEYRKKEEETMSWLKALAKQRFG